MISDRDTKTRIKLYKIIECLDIYDIFNKVTNNSGSSDNNDNSNNNNDQANDIIDKTALEEAITTLNDSIELEKRMWKWLKIKTKKDITTNFCDEKRIEKEDLKRNITTKFV